MKVVKIILSTIIVLCLVACTAIEEEIKDVSEPSKTHMQTPLATAAKTEKPLLTPIPTPILTPVPTKKVEPIILIDEAYLPFPGAEDWNEEEAISTNAFNYTSLLLIEDRIVFEGADIFSISDLNGENKIIYEQNESIKNFQYYNQWIYYLKENGIYKIGLDGKDKKHLVQIEASRFFVYNELIYAYQMDDNKITSMSLDGTNLKDIGVEDTISGRHYVSEGRFYYLGNVADLDPAGDSSDIYYLDLETNKSRKLIEGAYGAFYVSNGTIYCQEANVRAINGNETRVIIDYNENFVLFKNYIFYAAEYDRKNDSMKLFAYNLFNDKIYELFQLPGSTDYVDFNIQKDSMFISPVRYLESIYRLTFEEDTVKLWEYKGLYQ